MNQRTNKHDGKYIVCIISVIILVSFGFNFGVVIAAMIAAGSLFFVSFSYLIFCSLLEGIDKLKKEIQKISDQLYK